jgi:hypothetical protein
MAAPQFGGLRGRKTKMKDNLNYEAQLRAMKEMECTLAMDFSRPSHISVENPQDTTLPDKAIAEAAVTAVRDHVASCGDNSDRDAIKTFLEGMIKQQLSNAQLDQIIRHLRADGEVDAVKYWRLSLLIMANGELSSGLGHLEIIKPINGPFVVQMNVAFPSFHSAAKCAVQIDFGLPQEAVR